jgi:hypothetical protein
LPDGYGGGSGGRRAIPLTASVSDRGNVAYTLD